jgi:LemA protein
MSNYDLCQRFIDGVEIFGVVPWCGYAAFILIAKTQIIFDLCQRLAARKAGTSPTIWGNRQQIYRRADMVKIMRHFRLLSAIAAISLMLTGCGVNDIPTKQVKAQAAWGDVQSQYQRRADLVPNLVATVQGYAVQEKTVLLQVTQARASATQVRVDASTITDPAAFQRYQAAQSQLSGVLGRLLAISENYPDLKSNQNFLALQSQLEGTENRIAVARKDFNEAVRDYNTSLRTFPTIVWAKTTYSSAKPMQFFEATTTAQGVPKVSLTPSAAPAVSINPRSPSP